MLLIEFLKHPDGAITLRCTREDGSITFQNQSRHADHFIVHDLTHYAVETTLGYTAGFFGLIAAGWTIDDTTGKALADICQGKRLRSSILSGHSIPSALSATLWTPAEFNRFAPRPLSIEEIGKIREVRGAALARWREVQPGDALRLQFPAVANRLGHTTAIP